MTVYVDVVFGVNAVIDYLLLACSARLAGAPLHRGRMVGAAAVGGGFAAGSFLCTLLQLWPMKLVALVVMLLLAFGTGKNIWRQSALFLAASLALAGLVLAVAMVFDWGLVVLNNTAYYPVSWPALVLTAGLGYLVGDFFLQRVAQHGGGELVDTVVLLEHKQARLSALRDTGNTLRDPVSNAPILIVYWKQLQSLLPQQMQEAWLQDPTAHFATLCALTPQLRWRLLPYRAVGGQGMLLGVKTEGVRLDGKLVKHMTVALSPSPVCDGGGYTGLLGGER